MATVSQKTLQWANMATVSQNGYSEPTWLITVSQHGYMSQNGYSEPTWLQLSQNGQWAKMANYSWTKMVTVSQIFCLWGFSRRVSRRVMNSKFNILNPKSKIHNSTFRIQNLYLPKCRSNCVKMAQKAPIGPSCCMTHWKCPCQNGPKVPITPKMLIQNAYFMCNS